MKKISLEWFIAILCSLSLVLGILIGIYANIYTKKLALYNQYQHVVEKLLDECDAYHNICDDVCEGDTYAEYVELREKLGLE